MLKLEVRDLQWVKGPQDDPTDQCAHGCVAFAIDGIEFIRPSDGRLTVSAAALLHGLLQNALRCDGPLGAKKRCRW